MCVYRFPPRGYHIVEHPPAEYLDDRCARVMRQLRVEHSGADGKLLEEELEFVAAVDLVWGVGCRVEG